MGLVRKALFLRSGGVAVAVSVLLFGCASAEAHSPTVQAGKVEHGLAISMRAECGASVRTVLYDGRHSATLQVRVGEIGVGKEARRFGATLKGGTCADPEQLARRAELIKLREQLGESKEEAQKAQAGEEEQEEEPSLEVADYGNTQPRRTVTFLILINGIPVEGGTVFLVRRGKAPIRVWEGEDQFVNYCIDENKRITSIDGRLGCYIPGTYHEEALIAWNQ
jgi:hypothetical protein